MLGYFNIFIYRRILWRKWTKQITHIPDAISLNGQTELSQREDVVSDGGCAEDVLLNSPETKNGYFVVPKVIE